MTTLPSAAFLAFYLAESVMGTTMRKSYLAYKVDEWERYHQAVTDWEVQEYLRLY